MEFVCVKSRLKYKNLECLFLQREENWRTPAKTLGGEMKTNSKLTTH